MAQPLPPLTAEQLRERLRSTHPAERANSAAGYLKAPVREAKKIAEQAVAKTSNRVNELEAQLTKLTGQLMQVSQGLEVRKRMSPDDLRDALNSLFETYNFSPAEEMVQMIKDPSHPYYVEDPAMRLRILSELQSYVMPKLKSTEIKGTVDHKHTIVIKRFGDDGKVTTEAPPVMEKMEDRKQIMDVEEVKVPGTSKGGTSA
jgi:hypothetical protein